mgnify:CR=1 FL=1
MNQGDSEDDSPLFNTYHNYDQLTEVLHHYEHKYSNHSRLFSLGQTTQSREMYMMHLFKAVDNDITMGDESGDDEIDAIDTIRSSKLNRAEKRYLDDYINQRKPCFRYIGNVHGDEPLGRELLLRLIQLILDSVTDVNNGGSSSSDPYVSKWRERLNHLLSLVDVYILPSYNPDSYERMSRYNANGVDLNRNFPDPWFSHINQEVQWQAETENMIRFIHDNQHKSDDGPQRHFVLSGNIHGGSLVVSYGYDGLPSSYGTLSDRSGIYSASPDDDLNRYLAQQYSNSHRKMSYRESNYEFGGSPSYGITNGAHWYTLYGGMQDYVYLNDGSCNELTMELSMQKKPAESQLQTYWDDNLESMVQFMEQTYQSTIGGVIYCNNTNSVVVVNDTRINVHLTGKDGHNVSTTDGVYYRMIVPNMVYNVTFFSDDYTLVYRICDVRIEAGRTSILRLDVPIRVDPEQRMTEGINRLNCDEYFQPPPTVASLAFSNLKDNQMRVALFALVAFIALFVNQ